MKKAGTVGGTGYTSAELLRILSTHPEAERVVVTSRKEAGTPVADLFPSLRRQVALSFCDPATGGRPREMRCRVLCHTQRRGDSRNACVAQCGCSRNRSRGGFSHEGYRRMGKVVQHDSRVSGPCCRGSLWPSRDESRAHREGAAYCQSRLLPGSGSAGIFAADRGGSHPDTRSFRGANDCGIAVHHPDGGDTVVILSVIDNLVKGVAGQAVQNMNLMFGLQQTMGIGHVPLLP